LIGARQLPGHSIPTPQSELELAGLMKSRPAEQSLSHGTKFVQIDVKLRNPGFYQEKTDQTIAKESSGKQKSSRSFSH
jgi:hypothetical protein